MTAVSLYAGVTCGVDRISVVDDKTATLRGEIRLSGLRILRNGEMRLEAKHV